MTDNKMFERLNPSGISPMYLESVSDFIILNGVFASVKVTPKHNLMTSFSVLVTKTREAPSCLPFLQPITIS